LLWERDLELSTCKMEPLFKQVSLLSKYATTPILLSVGTVAP
jgi:hypothetical protein